MGREWLNRVSGGGGCGFSGRRGKMKDVAASAGCMCAVFQLLHFQSPSNHGHHTTSKEARDSLESNEPQMDASSPICIKEEEEDQIEFTVGIQIKTKLTNHITPSKSRRDDECSLDSPAGTKTPSIVARLMGLDLLPERTSPSISSGVNIKAQSLPETPRISLVQSSDVEYHTPRLSLQINKENLNREFEFSEKLRERLRHQQRDENGSSARHFVERVKDRVSRRRGAALADITNDKEQTSMKRRDRNLIPVKVKNTRSGTKYCENDSQLQEQRVSKKDGSGENGKKNNIKSKRTQLLVMKNKSPPPTKLHPKQSQVSLSDAISSRRSPRLSIEQAPEKIRALPDIPTGCAAALPGRDTSEYEIYIKKILNRAGISNESKPIDPSIFHYLEHFHPITAASGGNAVLNRRCNRKLIFQLVNELMTEISRSHFSFNRWVPPIMGRDGGSPLVEELCKTIGSFPAGGCLVREEMDSLVERELRKLESKELFREEESVVRQIEGEIVESLLCETAAMAVRGDGCHV